MQCAGLKKIGNEAPLAEQKPPIFKPPQRRAYAFCPLLLPPLAGDGKEGSAALRPGRDYCNSSRTRSRRSKADLSVTMNRSASPALDSCRAQVQCGMVNTSCCDHSNVFSPTVERPSPATTRQTTL